MKNTSPSRSPKVHFRLRRKQTKEQVVTGWVEDLAKDIDIKSSILFKITPLESDTDIFMTRDGGVIPHYQLINFVSSEIKNLSEKINAWIRKYKHI